jgi:predicted enzyme related to lactoylglutathione lyase
MDTSIMNSKSAVAVLPASDINRAISFYRDQVGLEVEVPEQMPGSAFVRTGEGTFFIYETQFKGGEATALMIVVDDAEAVRDNLREHGVKIEEYDLPDLKTVDGLVEYGGLKGGWFKDSEGNTINFGEMPAEVMRKAA